MTQTMRITQDQDRSRRATGCACLRLSLHDCPELLTRTGAVVCHAYTTRFARTPRMIDRRIL